MTSPYGQSLLDRAYGLLRDLLIDHVAVRLSSFNVDLPESTATEAVWTVSAVDSSSPLLVQAFAQFSPRDAGGVLGGVSSLVRQMMRDPPVLVVAPWLSPRARRALTSKRIGYLDLTGNVWLTVRRPVIELRADGARKDPRPVLRSGPKLRGAGANALVRILVEVAPPYGVSELAGAAGLSAPYVSRLVAALDAEGVVDRVARGGTVVDVDWAELLRTRAEQYDFVASNNGRAFVAPDGAIGVYRRLAESRPVGVLVTGAYAAASRQNLDLPRATRRTESLVRLALYVPAVEPFAVEHTLVPAKSGQVGEVLLLRAAHQSHLERPHLPDAHPGQVGISQLVVDCLSGDDQSAEAGEALLNWMAEDAAKVAPARSGAGAGR